MFPSTPLKKGKARATLAIVAAPSGFFRSRFAKLLTRSIDPLSCNNQRHNDPQEENKLLIRNLGRKMENNETNVLKGEALM
ncbi:hypothetical protein L3X38_013025 [Prunus dulcis]|uniref:Uncharacterized protein n=1 Tax=Prunus dulcis TaxID=3755 RepID=A0AAD4WL70_PRUDU|nr:hypothetical protein L3X38_013025 [Prunus dulcis]